MTSAVRLGPLFSRGWTKGILFLGEASWTQSAPFCWVLPTMVVAVAGPLLSSLTDLVFSLWLHCLPNESILPSEMTPSIKTVKSAVARPHPTVPRLPVILPSVTALYMSSPLTGHFATCQSVVCIVNYANVTSRKAGVFTCYSYLSVQPCYPVLGCSSRT